MIEVVNLVKRYGPLLAIDNVSFSISAGETIGLLGANGAGKTTLLSMIAGILKPDSGEVRIDSRLVCGDSDPLKRSIGLIPQEIALYDELSASANLRFFGGLYDLDGPSLNASMKRVLELVGLTDRARQPVKNFSGGMKRRLNLAASLLHDPTILLMDEPTVGVDPQSRNALFENLETLRAEGKCIVYSTHYMEEAERLCNRVMILDKGRVLANDLIKNLHESSSTGRILIELDDPTDGAWLSTIRELQGVTHVELSKERLTVNVRDLGTAPAVLSCVAESGQRINYFASERATLESVFLRLTGRSLRDS